MGEVCSLLCDDEHCRSLPGAKGLLGASKCRAIGRDRARRKQTVARRVCRQLARDTILHVVSRIVLQARVQPPSSVADHVEAAGAVEISDGEDVESVETSSAGLPDLVDTSVQGGAVQEDVEDLEDMKDTEDTEDTENMEVMEDKKEVRLIILDNNIV